VIGVSKDQPALARGDQIEIRGIGRCLRSGLGIKACGSFWKGADLDRAALVRKVL